MPRKTWRQEPEIRSSAHNNAAAAVFRPRRQPVSSLRCNTLDKAGHRPVASDARQSPLHIAALPRHRLRELLISSPDWYQRITQHLLCVHRNPDFQIALEESENIFSMLNVRVNGVAQGAPWSSRNCYSLFQSSRFHFMVRRRNASGFSTDVAVQCRAHRSDVMLTLQQNSKRTFVK